MNNAGILRDRMITSMTEDDFDAVIAVHLKGTFQMTKHACDHWRSMAKAGKGSEGRIINTTSGAGFSGNVGQASYAAAKGGIISSTLTTALEMARYEVTANAVSPVARTRMSADLSSFGSGISEEDDFDPLDPGLISPVVAYLASSHSGWLSGQVLRVEGNTLFRMEGWRKGEGTYRSREWETVGGRGARRRRQAGLRSVPLRRMRAAGSRQGRSASRMVTAETAVGPPMLCANAIRAPST